MPDMWKDIKGGEEMKRLILAAVCFIVIFAASTGFAILVFPETVRALIAIAGLLFIGAYLLMMLGVLAMSGVMMLRLAARYLARLAQPEPRGGVARIEKPSTLAEWNGGVKIVRRKKV